MNSVPPDVIEQADLLIKEGRFNSARKLLLPYQNHPSARKRLVWLHQKREQALHAKEAQNLKSPPRQRSRLYLITSLIFLVVLGMLAVSRLLPVENLLPSVAGKTTSLAPAASLAAPSITQVPPTENPQEDGLQQQLRDWLVTVAGVTNVLSLDVDVPNDQPPLVYAEIAVNPGYNDNRIPDIFVQKLNNALNTSQYSDFVIIINDESQVIEYMFNSENSTWQQTQLASTMPSSSG